MPLLEAPANVAQSTQNADSTVFSFQNKALKRIRPRGDAALTITPPPLPTRPDGKLRVSVLVWEKAE